MKKLIITTLFMIPHAWSWACTVCEKQQPKLLRGITHGAGPESNWDYVIIFATVAVVLGTLILSVRHLWKPNENEMSHIKNSILKPEFYE
jgi:hypothetical protein